MPKQLSPSQRRVLAAKEVFTIARALFVEATLTENNESGDDFDDDEERADAATLLRDDATQFARIGFELEVGSLDAAQRAYDELDTDPRERILPETTPHAYALLHVEVIEAR
jgi:hypothetical protein